MSRYDDFLDAYGERLGEAEPPRRITRGPLLTAVAAVVAVAVAAVAVLAIAPGGTKLDAVARAQEALSPAGQILHVVMTTEMEKGSFDSVPPPETSELWYAQDPVRWRFAWAYPAGMNGTAFDADGNQLSGRQEESYANGTVTDYEIEDHLVHVTTDLSDADQTNAERAPGVTDLLDTLRSLLAAGKLRDDGLADVGGRSVRKLVETNVATDGNATSKRTTTYYVDPDTFAPISGSLSMEDGNDRGMLPVSTIDFTVDTYETLPETSDNEKLLAISPPPGTTVITRSGDDARAREEQYLKDPNTPPTINPGTTTTTPAPAP